MSVRIKICGINTLESLKASASADFLGFVFYPKSPRFINAEKAKVFSKLISKEQKIVGLFVDTDPSVVEYITKYVGLDLLQFHGQESPEKIKYFKKKLNIPIIKSINVSCFADTEKYKEYNGICDIILFDSAPTKTNLYGGSGEKFDWKFLTKLRIKGDWMLAGGICKENLIEALQITKAPIIDISSGLESEKGIKSVKKIKEFLKLVKSINSKNVKKNKL